MLRPELDVLVDWAAAEGWNPGLHDADIFWSTDPAGFVAAESGGELGGGGSIVSYDGRFGFMGFFIVAPALRGRGLGTRLWHHRRDALLARLHPGAAIGMDGVFEMQPFYAKGGFVFAGRDLRFEGTGEPTAFAPALVDADEVPFDALLAYDDAHFPAPRPAFLERWITQPGARTLVAVEHDHIRGYGVIRPCRRGFKIGPLFAADAGTAEDLFLGLGDHAAGQPILLDAPETNPAAIALARRHGMREVFGCARMYLGPAPALPDAEIFGVTTFELGSTVPEDWYPRDLRGHGRHPPNPRWPGDARVAVSFVLNLEEGGERSPEDGDPTAEPYLHDLPGAVLPPGARHTGIESLFDYGARAGLWRLLRLFERHRLPLTAFAVGQALERNPDAGAALAELGHEVAGHGYRWIDYRQVPPHVEREHIRRTVAAIEATTGRRPVGWYTGRVSPNTRRLLVQEGGFAYDSDSYADDLPFWVRGHLVIPYSLVTNDMRCVTAGDVDISRLLSDAFDLLWEEGEEAPKMMSVGLHPRISGQPARAAGLARFLDHVASRDRVWVCRRMDIADHWARLHPA